MTVFQSASEKLVKTQRTLTRKKDLLFSLFCLFVLMYFLLQLRKNGKMQALAFHPNKPEEIAIIVNE